MCNKVKQTVVPDLLGGLDVLAPHSCVLVPGSLIQGDAEDGRYSSGRGLQKEGEGLRDSVIFLLLILHGLQEDAVLQAVLEVVDHSPLEVLDAAWTPQIVALIGV